MATPNPIIKHRQDTKRLAESLAPADVYSWLVDHGYFPESYVLPPCFTVKKRPLTPKRYYTVSEKGHRFDVPRTDYVSVHFPKSEYTDRTFGIMHPEIHNDIAYDIAMNWQDVVRALFPDDSSVTSYSFPIPVDSENAGRVGSLRSGRMIYEFLSMNDEDLVSVAYRYTHLVRTDIKNFYPSLYTHSIAWALHGKEFVRKPKNIHNYNLLGNRLDKLFQNANDGCTNGVPIGPVVSDVVAEIVASGVDRILSKFLVRNSVECEVVRFKDDYRVLVKSKEDGRRVIKALQEALKQFNLELNDEKTSISTLPNGLFREWVSMYHAVHPRKLARYSWKAFRELYLAVLRIDKACPGTGVIDRFLSDIVSKKGNLKVRLGKRDLQKVLSMLFMLASLRVKAFPKVIAIIETVIRTPLGIDHRDEILGFLNEYLNHLSDDERRNRYLITWLCYFFVSNGFKDRMSVTRKYEDPVIRSVYENRGAIFAACKEHKIFVGCISTGRTLSMLEHLKVFDPPKVT